MLGWLRKRSLASRPRAADAVQVAPIAAPVAPAPITAEARRSADDHYRHGEQARERGDVAGAIDAFTKAVAIDPSHGEAHNNLGGLLRSRGRDDEALKAFRSAVASRPTMALAWFNLGTLLRDRGELIEAIAALERSLSLDPNQADAHYWLGNAWMGSGDAAKAVASYRSAIRLDANLLVARWGLTMAQIDPVPPSIEAAAASRESFSRELDKLASWCRAKRPSDGFLAVGAQQPYYLAYQQHPNQALLQRYGRLCTELMRPWEAKVGLPATKPPRGARLKVGIVSAHFHNHSVWNAIVRGWFEHIDPRKIELHGFHLGRQQDGETRFARERATTFQGGAREWSGWAKALSESRLDVLVYPEIGMDSSTAKLAAARLAPVQIASWGHPETSGLPSIDHFVSAAGMEPSDAASFYSEQLHALPGLGCCARRFGTAPAKVDMKSFGIPEGSVVMLCAGVPFKYTPEHDGLYVRIAQGSPNAHLVFFRGQPDLLAARLQARLRKAFTEAGLDFERHVSFVPWQHQAGFFGLMKAADLYLDSPGFSGFNTTLQAVECGLPVVAWEGAFLRGRFASGILGELGLTDEIASTADGYVDIVTRLAADAGERRRIRSLIEARRGALFGHAASARAMQDLLLELTM